MDYMEVIIDILTPMTESEMKEAILQAIIETYCKKYIGTLEVEKIIPEGWIVRLGMNNDEKPIVISAELSDEKFLKFFIKELRDRNWNTIHWFLGYKLYPDNGCPHDSRCKTCKQ